MPLTRSQQPPPSLSPSSPDTVPVPSTSASSNQDDAPVTMTTIDNTLVEPPKPKNSVRIPNPAVPYFKLARKSLQGRTHAEHHATYLKLCLDNNTTPRGLQNQIPAAIPEQDFSFQIDWERAHNDFARNLTGLLHDYYSQRAARLKDQLELCNSHIVELCNPETQIHIQNLLNNIKRELESELENRRNSKITRDTGDLRNTN